MGDSGVNVPFAELNEAWKSADKDEAQRGGGSVGEDGGEGGGRDAGDAGDVGGDVPGG